jgi:hypothetical protein
MRSRSLILCIIQKKETVLSGKAGIEEPQGMGINTRCVACYPK